MRIEILYTKRPTEIHVPDACNDSLLRKETLCLLMQWSKIHLDHHWCKWMTGSLTAFNQEYFNIQSAIQRQEILQQRSLNFTSIQMIISNWKLWQTCEYIQYTALCLYFIHIVYLVLETVKKTKRDTHIVYSA